MRNIHTQLEQRLELKIAPILIERLNLLQLPRLELCNLIEQKLEENPLLEIDEEEGEELVSLKEDIKFLEPYPYSEEKEEPKEKLPIPDQRHNLHEFLLSQVRTKIKDEKLLKIAEYIIYEIDKDGYLLVSAEDIAKDLNEKQELIEEMIKKLQEIFPAGICSRNLQECIILQLKNNGAPNTAIKIVKELFTELKNQDYKKIMNELNISSEELGTALSFIKLCRPKPGRLFSSDVRYIIPDLVIENKNGEWTVSFCTEWFPKIRLSKYYEELIENPDLKKEEKSFLKNKIREATLLLEGINKRKELMLAIGNYILENEKEFIVNQGDIKLLDIKDVAKCTGRNISTIYRAISGKYIQTPYGIYSIKEFFSSGKIENYSQIIDKIKQLIENENKTNPLTDNEIVNILKKDNFDIARTTVVKYRKQLNIPNANKRKL